MRRGSFLRIIRLKHIDVSMEVQPTLLGEKFIVLRCASKGCPLGCVMSLRIPIELWSASEEKIAAVLSLPCERLVKLANETAKLDGRQRVISCVDKVGS